MCKITDNLYITETQIFIHKINKQTGKKLIILTTLFIRVKMYELFDYIFSERITKQMFIVHAK